MVAQSCGFRSSQFVNKTIQSENNEIIPYTKAGIPILESAGAHRKVNEAAVFIVSGIGDMERGTRMLMQNQGFSNLNIKKESPGSLKSPAAIFLGTNLQMYYKIPFLADKGKSSFRCLL